MKNVIDFLKFCTSTTRGKILAQFDPKKKKLDTTRYIQKIFNVILNKSRLTGDLLFFLQALLQVLTGRYGEDRAVQLIAHLLMLRLWVPVLVEQSRSHPRLSKIPKVLLHLVRCALGESAPLPDETELCAQLSPRILRFFFSLKNELLIDPTAGVPTPGPAPAPVPLNAGSRSESSSQIERPRSASFSQTEPRSHAGAERSSSTQML